MARSDSQEQCHQKMATRRQRWLAPFISFGRWCWTSPKAAWSIFIVLVVLVIGGVTEYNLVENPDAGISNPKLAAHVTTLSTKIRRERYSRQQLRQIFNDVKIRMTDRQVLNVARANEAKLVKKHSQTGEWMYTTKDLRVQVFVSFNDGRVVSKTYNTNDYSAEVRWDCGNSYQEKVFENGQPVKSGKELRLP